MNLKNYYPKKISEFDDDYINKIEKTKIFDEFKDIYFFIELENKINSPFKKKLKYFEIVDENVKYFFIINNNAKEKYFIPCSYKVKYGKY